MRRRVPVLLCALLLTSIVCGAAPVGAQSSVEETRFEAQLQSDGDARWSIVATVPLEDEGDVENFRSFGEAFEGGERDFQLGSDAFRRAAESASEASGREMSIHAESREATVVEETEDGETRRYGELRVSFTWTSFARVDEDGTMYVDDAFNTTRGTWMTGLENDQTLVIRSPPGYGGPSTSPIGAEDGDLTWEGPQSFEPGYFEIEYPPTGSALLGASLSTILLVVAVILSAAALSLGGYLLWRRDEGLIGGSAADDESGHEAGISGDGGDVATEQAAATAGADTVRGDDAASDPPDDADGDTEEEPDLELLSDEERVEHLLDRNGGRMKQANIVKETGWSNAKVSQLLSGMADDERVEKLRIGRENLISLPGENVGDVTADGDDE